MGYLDTTLSGPLWLRRPEIADLVSSHLHRGEDDGLYQLTSWVVMSNHVHLLVHPRVQPSEAIRTVKGRSAREANRVLGRTGEPFWQAESYDHWVRNAPELARIARYIENNPVAAGLVVRAEDYRWSSAWAEATEKTGAEAPVAG